MSIKISSIRYFPFGFKMNEKKKEVLKNYGLERGVKRKIMLLGLTFDRGAGNISKRES